MYPSKIGLFTIAVCFVVSGCDSKAQKQQAADLKAATEIAEKAAEQLEQAQAASKGVSPEQAPQVQTQSEISKEFELLMEPFLTLNNQLLDLGGIDAVTLSSIRDVDNRIAMIEQLFDMNEMIDLRFPVLFKQINGADSPEGKQQLAMAKEMRATNREAYPHMKESLLIVKEYWETSGNADDGNFYFGDDVPQDVVEAYNKHLAAVDAIGVRQLEIQRGHYEVP